MRLRLRMKILSHNIAGLHPGRLWALFAPFLSLLLLLLLLLLLGPPRPVLPGEAEGPRRKGDDCKGNNDDDAEAAEDDEGDRELVEAGACLGVNAGRMDHHLKIWTHAVHIEVHMSVVT